MNTRIKFNQYELLIEEQKCCSLRITILKFCGMEFHLKARGISLIRAQEGKVL